MLKPENLKTVLQHPKGSGLIIVAWVWGMLFLMYSCTAVALFEILKSLVKGKFQFPLWAFAMFVFTAYLAFFSSLVAGVVRYRVPMIPGIALLAGWGGMLIYQKWNKTLDKSLLQ